MIEPELEKIEALLQKWIDKNPNRSFIGIWADPDDNRVLSTVKGYKKVVIASVRTAIENDTACKEIAKIIHERNITESNSSILN